MPAWDHKRTRTVELGDEPPITVGDTDPSRYTRRGISLRWLFGALVTAVTSTALMGGALFAALDGRYVVRAEAAALDAATQPRARKAEKGDRVRPVYEEVSTRRIIDVPTVVRQGDQSIIGKRPYALVNASLVLDPAGIGSVPPFTAKEVASAEAPTANSTDAIYDQAVDGEITVSVSAFPLDSAANFDDAQTLGEEDIERQLRGVTGPVSELKAIEDDSFVDTAAAPVAPNLVVVPENVSKLIKTADQDDDDSTESELVELVQPGDTLRKILIGSGVAAADIEAIDGVLSRMGVGTLKRGQTLRIAFQLDEELEDAQRRPSRFTVYEAGRHVATVAMTDGGQFVLGEAPAGPTPEVKDVQVEMPDSQLPSVYRSLWQTMRDHDIPERVRDLLLQTFSLDVDFNVPARPGDRLLVLYSASEEPDAPVEVLYASLLAAGVERKFYRYKAADGTVDYLDEEGKTGDKFLIRKPMERGIFRSGFGMRRHPIFGRARMHGGVDYAAPRGTKIYAAGDGVIEEAGWKAGYGRWVLVRHRNGYETGYGHQSRIADGIRPGTTVKQGQIIGYVGSTGFSTGPHLHFEVHVNGRPVNPLKIRLPRGKELSGESLVAFNAEVERIDALIDDRRETAGR